MKQRRKQSVAVMANQPEETNLIQKYFAPLAAFEGLGLADDAACLSPEPGTDLVISTDTIVEGVHFLPTDPPVMVGLKAITVNLSDIIAKGARPLGYQIALSLPQKPDENWVLELARGIGSQANGMIFGGDITVSKGGPLTISITAIGEVPSGKMVRRNGANVGDDIYVAGKIGTSAVGLKCALDIVWAKKSDLSATEISDAITRYAAPVVVNENEIWPLVQRYATASLDISDGLAIDLERLCTASQVGANIKVKSIPLHGLTRKLIKQGAFTIEEAITGGDDYVALFTAASTLSAEEKAEISKYCHPIGKIVETKKGVIFSVSLARTLSLKDGKGYDHFSK